MNLKQYFVIMGLASILCWSALVTVLLNIDPYTANAFGFTFFYGSFFLAVFGTVSLFLFPLYFYLSREQLPLYRYVQKSFRNSLIFSFIVTVLLLLQGLHVFTVWNFSILVLASISVFAFMYSLKKDYYQN